MNVTNTSVTLQWLPPTFPNGVVRHYYVYYYLENEKHLEQQQQDFIDSSDDQQSIYNEHHFITVYDTKVYTFLFFKVFRNN